MFEVEILNVVYCCPIWAKFVAKDANDEWYAYDKEPTVSEKNCKWVQKDNDEEGHCKRITPVKTDDWRATLHEVQ